MIRKFQPDNRERVMQLWLSGNLDAHSFVPRDYWISHAPMVRELLVQAELYVCELDGDIRGFAGVQDGSLAGIFVDQAHRSMGIGKRLLDYIKKRHPLFTLNVYQRNQRAVEFYLREGLSVIAEGIDEGTGEMDYTMQWSET